MPDKVYDTLVEAVNALIAEGFDESFKAQEDLFIALNSKATYKPEDLKITRVYRFEGQTNPADSAELFAMEAADGVKGTLVMSYSAQHSQNEDLIRKVKIEGR